MKALYANRQWAVTTYGLECPPRDYTISKSDLAENCHWMKGRKRRLSKWILHVCPKLWCDPQLFVDAFEQALKIHRVVHDLDIKGSKAEVAWYVGCRSREQFEYREQSMIGHKGRSAPAEEMGTLTTIPASMFPHVETWRP